MKRDSVENACWVLCLIALGIVTGILFSRLLRERGAPRGKHRARITCRGCPRASGCEKLSLDRKENGQ